MFSNETCTFNALLINPLYSTGPFYPSYSGFTEFDGYFLFSIISVVRYN